MSDPAARKIFGTEGVRGVAHVEPVTAETAREMHLAMHNCRTSVSGRLPRTTGQRTVLPEDYLGARGEPMIFSKR